jgi:hypothetical protein
VAVGVLVAQSGAVSPKTRDTELADELAARIEAGDAHDVLVVGSAGATLTCFET